MSNAQQNMMIEFFRIFTEPVVKVLNQELDKEVCTKIQLKVNSTSEVRDAEELKNNNAVYKIDYATGDYQGKLVVLLPEEFVAYVADILMGGTGKGAYKGSLSELETNSLSKVMEQVFKEIENTLKKKHELNLAYSARPQLLLKELKDDYVINTDDMAFDLYVDNTLSLNEETEFKIGFLLTTNITDKVMMDLGFNKADPTARKVNINALCIKNLEDVKIDITAELGRTRVPIKYALELVRGSLIELDTINNSDIKVYANEVLFAYAQVVAVEENFGLKITKIVSPQERMEAL